MLTAFCGCIINRVACGRGKINWQNERVGMAGKTITFQFAPMSKSAPKKTVNKWSGSLFSLSLYLSVSQILHSNECMIIVN